MESHTVKIGWVRSDSTLIVHGYSRVHAGRFDGRAVGFLPLVR
jgi:hypothetical protein